MLYLNPKSSRANITRAAHSTAYQLTNCVAVGEAMATGKGRLKTVLSDTEFQKELIAAGESVVVVDFYAPG